MSDYPVVKLNWSECLIAAQAGLQRKISGMAKDRTQYHGKPDSNDWQIDIEGALAEFAVSKYLDLHWSGQGGVRCDDVGSRNPVDVRSTQHPTGRLIVHENDPDDRIFFLVVGMYGKYEMIGYTTGKRGKECGVPTYRENSTSLFVPREHLNPPDQFFTEYPRK